MDTTPPHGSALVFEGLLYKQSKWLKSWRLRYFKLYSTPSGPRLYFSNDESAPPHGIIELNNCLTVKSADDKTGKPNSFEVATASDVFFMHAVDGRHDGREKTASALKDEWVGAIGKAIVMTSKSYRTRQDDDDDDDDDEAE